ncbi:transmembrane protein, putative [Medicago truncatula]|uniref:Transmembrane protein, putative n=1 Tax=Medicago truncatula TaxID=3880 RepID=G7J0S6_MEDTR|nr:transmembrane protein, putative [Medicago truncatula]
MYKTGLLIIILRPHFLTISTFIFFSFTLTTNNNNNNNALDEEGFPSTTLPNRIPFPKRIGEKQICRRFLSPIVGRWWLVVVVGNLDELCGFGFKLGLGFEY